MGRLNEEWQQDFIAALQDKGIKVTGSEEGNSDLILLSFDKLLPTKSGALLAPSETLTSALEVQTPKLAVNLVSLATYKYIVPADLLHLQTSYQDKGIYLVHLWEDIWKSKTKQVLGRIESIIGINKKLHGRKAVITTINQKEADDFLIENHLQGSARVKYKFALKIDGQIVAVALFSAKRPMNLIAEDYYSYELVRFATLIGFTVTGGFTKLLKHFIQLVQPNDIMSYADRDWSLGHAYENSGFKMAEETLPLEIWLGKNDSVRYFPHRIPENTDESSYLPIFNTGNLKYILYL